MPGNPVSLKGKVLLLLWFGGVWGVLSGNLIPPSFLQPFGTTIVNMTSPVHTALFFLQPGSLFLFPFLPTLTLAVCNPTLTPSSSQHTKSSQLLPETPSNGGCSLRLALCAARLSTVSSRPLFRLCLLWQCFLLYHPLFFTTTTT